MYFQEAADQFNKILEEEKINLTDSFKSNFLNIMSEMCNYTEEDHKIRPQIILGVNLQTYFETITPKNYIVMFEDELVGEKIPRYFKSLALFCDNGWYIVINSTDEKLQYGIFRRYSNIDGERFEDYFCDDIISDGHMIILKAINNSDISITRHSKPEFIISQKFIVASTEGETNKNKFLDLANDITAGCYEENVYIKKCVLKMFRNFPQKVHGTIMLVVEDTFKLPEEGLAGISISPPIDFSNTFLQYRKVERYDEAENVYSLTGILYEMLNIDGITIISNKARVLYYNVFYEGIIPKDIKGGARKRTAMGILMNKELQGIIGVYFQSQDGDIFYQRRECSE